MTRIRECPGTTVETAPHMGTDEARGPEPQLNGSPWKSVSPGDKVGISSLQPSHGAWDKGVALPGPQSRPSPSELCSMPRPAPGSSLHCQVCAPASCDSRYGMYVEVLPLMVSLEVEARTPHCADGEPGESLRGTGSVQGHGPGHEQKPGLKPALRPHSGDTGCTQAPWGL